MPLAAAARNRSSGRLSWDKKALLRVRSLLHVDSIGFEQIGNLLSNPDPDVRKRVVVILGHVGRREAVDKLWEQLAQEEKEEIRRNIRDAIRQSLSKTER